ncbi:MAG: AraC family transcriptional regulator [Rubrivivax sp.]|nr:AraC family transcriptional regulator [Rubrivivax sp.]
MRPVEHAIWLIESRLGENPSLDDIARETGLSRYYICRVFAEETGTTLAAYVRSRRLGEAAKALLGGAPNILDVALAAGYGSHEAFTRAFRAEFGCSPEEVRARGQEAPLRLKEPLRMKAAQQVPLDPPRLQTLPATRFVGLARTYTMTQLGAIPQQWEVFQRQHLSRIDRAKVPAAFGIVHHAAHDGENVQYLCALPAGSGLQPGDASGDAPGDAPGSELVELALPEMRVAQFAHRGHISGIGASTRAVFEEGLPAAGPRPVGPVDLIEHYGPDFDPRSGFGTVGLWVQVEPAGGKVPARPACP